MSELARTDVATLAHLKVVLTRYAVEVAEIARDEGSACARVVTELGATVQLRTRDLAQAQQVLQDCRRQPDADCSGPARTVQHATQRLEAAQRGLRLAEAAVARHASVRHRFVQAVADLTGSGAGELTRLADAAGEYLGRAAASSLGSAGGAAPGGGPSSTGADAVGGLPAGCTAVPGAPAGCALVPLGLIDLSDSRITGAASFGKGYSPEDLAWAHSTLHEVVLPALAAGKDHDYFVSRDAESGRHGSRSLADTHSGFFGDSAITLDATPDGRLSVSNGYHRIWVAQQMGLTHVVARVR